MQRTPCVLGGNDHVVDDGGRKPTPSMRGIEKPQTSASTTATDLPAAQGDSQVGGDRRLAYAALAGRNQQNAGAVTGLGERDRSASA